jgi:multisubunit Na+/H+ antiporter MnhB subunit
LQLLKKTTSRELQGKIYHAIGRYHYFDLRDYKTALVMFKKACKVYPEQYNDPTQSAARSFIEVCSAEYSLIVIKRLVKAILFAVILITIALYGVTKPWKWFSAKKFTALLLLICGAVVLFLLLDHIASRAVSPSSGYFYAPVFSNEQLEGFGSRIRTSILLFFITGVIAIIIAVIPLSRIRFRFTRTALSLLFTLLVFLGITGLFCFHQTRGRSDFSTFSFEMNEASAFPYLTGKWYWMAKDFKPYVISDPRKFMNLNVYLSNEPVFKDWLEDKYAKIKALNHKDEGANN